VINRPARDVLGGADLHPGEIAGRPHRDIEQFPWLHPRIELPQQLDIREMLIGNERRFCTSMQVSVRELDWPGQTFGESLSPHPKNAPRQVAGKLELQLFDWKAELR
jgi:hypothetical protein